MTHPLYGRVNQAIRGLVLETHGEYAWDQIVAAADLGGDTGNRDAAQVTRDLVHAAATTLNAGQDDVLRALGRSWANHGPAGTYGPLPEVVDACLAAFAEHRGRHTATSLAPATRIERRSPGVYHVHCGREHAGLAPLVQGLVEGLTERDGRPMSIRAIDSETAAVLELRLTDD